MPNSSLTDFRHVVALGGGHGLGRVMSRNVFAFLFRLSINWNCHHDG